MDMIERVARAMSLCNHSVEVYWEEYLPDGRAAIEAMRVPTDAVAEAVFHKIGVGSPSLFKAIFADMIDATLAPSPAKGSPE